METLEQELGLYIEKLGNAENFRKISDEISSIYPFNKYEYIISALLSKNDNKRKYRINQWLYGGRQGHTAGSYRAI
jgi:hypothetical protein